MPAPDPNALGGVANVLSSSGGGNIWALLITAVSAVTGKYAWDFYKKKAILNKTERSEIRKDVKDEKLLDRKDRNSHRDELKERVEKLEQKLDKAIKDKEDLMVQVGELKAQVAALSVKIELLVGNMSAGVHQAPKPDVRPEVSKGSSSGAKSEKSTKAKLVKDPEPPAPAPQLAKKVRKKNG